MTPPRMPSRQVIPDSTATATGLDRRRLGHAFPQRDAGPAARFAADAAAAEIAAPVAGQMIWKLVR